MKFDANTLRAALATQNRVSFLTDTRKATINGLLNEGHNVNDIAELMFAEDPSYKEKYIRERVKSYVQRLLARVEQTPVVAAVVEETE